MSIKPLISYLPELYYFFDLNEFSQKNFRKSVLIVAKTIAQWSDYYSAKLLSPIKGVKVLKKKGKLPINKKEKVIFVENLVNWIFDNSEVEGLFLLFLDDSKVIANRSAKQNHPKFNHYDDTCCWVLNLTEKEFQKFRSSLKKSKLPEDLFYESSRTRCISNKPKTMAGRFFHSLGLQSRKCYTPKQLEIKIINN